MLELHKIVRIIDKNRAFMRFFSKIVQAMRQH